MKSYNDCMAWVKSIQELAKNLPEGVAIHPSTNGHASRYCLKDVSWEAVEQIAAENGATMVGAGSEVRAYTYVDVRLPKLPTAQEGRDAGQSQRQFSAGWYKLKALQKEYRFFYRKTSATHVPHQSPAATNLSLGQGADSAAGDAGAGVPEGRAAYTGRGPRR